MNGLQKQKIKNYETRPKKIVDFRKLRDLSIKLKKEGKKIVFTTGSYDLLNPGHCRYLSEAKSKGDVLIVGVSTDASDSRNKGSAYPLIGQEIRAELVSFLKTVDYVIITDEDRPHAVLALLQPDVFFTSEDAWNISMRDPQEEFIVKMYGGRVVRRKMHKPYFRTGQLGEHIANIRVIQILENYLNSKVSSFNLDPVKHLKPADFGLQKPLFKSFDSGKLIIKYENLKKLGEGLRKNDKKIVFVSGSYDLLHVGHARFIEQAGLLGDVLVVGIPSDKSIRELKGIGRPVISQYSRAYTLGHLDSVDYVVVFDDNTVRGALGTLKPDVFFTVAEEWNSGYKESPECKLVKSYGGDVVLAKRQAPFVSASAIIDKIAQFKVKEIFKECMNEERYNKIVLEKPRV